MRTKIEILTTKDVAHILGVGLRRVQYLAHAGTIPSYRPKGHRNFIFLKKDIAKYVGMPEDIL